ncbi:hypothetical protein, partial [Acrocarpospora corrugata]|uniref:hypothetical protein n=1 Tax=Acrocarpospora corrugata TaxID=35763 RepID=UPI0012D356BD
MSLLRVLTKPLRHAYDHRGELLAKAKDLPMVVVQTALSGVGQALLIGDRVRTTLKRLTTTDENTTKTPDPEQTPPRARHLRPPPHQA